MAVQESSKAEAFHRPVAVSAPEVMNRSVGGVA